MRVYTPLLAEEFGIAAANVKAWMGDPDPEVQRFPNRTGGFEVMIEVHNEWAAHVVRQVSSYAEHWDRNVTPLDLQRGLNRLWTEGGIHYPPLAR